MRWRRIPVWVAVFVLLIGSRASAQATPDLIRFVTDSTGANAHWQGTVEFFTRDSLFLRVLGSDTVAAFARKDIQALERERIASPGRWAILGCLNVGGALGSFGYFGSRDPDSPGIEKRIGLFSLGAGCILGAFTGAVLARVHGHDWEAWAFPEDDTGGSLAYPDGTRVNLVVYFPN